MDAFFTLRWGELTFPKMGDAKLPITPFHFGLLPEDLGAAIGIKKIVPQMPPFELGGQSGDKNEMQK